jgi:phosphoheptose isomerase
MHDAELISQLLQIQPDLAETAPALLHLCDRLAEIFRAGGTLFVAGNGGSAADAQHIARGRFFGEV